MRPFKRACQSSSSSKVTFGSPKAADGAQVKGPLLGAVARGASAIRHTLFDPETRKKTLATALLLTTTPTFMLSSCDDMFIPRDNLNLTQADLDLTGAPGMAAAIVKDGKIVGSDVIGMADAKNGTPVDFDTAFGWASVSKPLIAISVMQLNEQGKLGPKGLDEDISKALGFKPGDRDITYRQLLTHTSSIVDNEVEVPGGWVEGKDSDVPLSEVVEGHLKPGGKFYDGGSSFSGQPGEEEDYSNMGATTAAYLVEKLSGQKFHEYVRDNIVEPLGMENASYMYRDINPTKYARPNGDQEFVGDAVYPSGSFTAPAEDMAKVLAVLSNDGSYNGTQLLKPESVKEILTLQPPFKQDQGLILYTTDDYNGGETLWTHDGDIDGVNTELAFDPKTETGVIVATNGEENENDLRAVMQKLLDEVDQTGST